MDKSICVTYEHLVKGFWGDCRTEESEYFWLDGFSAGTLAEQPDLFYGLLNKTMNHMKKESSFTNSMLTIYYPDVDDDWYSKRTPAFRIFGDSNGAGGFSWQLVTWEKENREGVKQESTKKAILDYAKKFFYMQMAEIIAA